MGELTTYGRPYPPMTDRANGLSCPATQDGWHCTRPVGHEGRHEAGNPRGRMYASWGRSTSELLERAAKRAKGGEPPC